MSRSFGFPKGKTHQILNLSGKFLGFQASFIPLRCISSLTRSDQPIDNNCTILTQLNSPRNGFRWSTHFNPFLKYNFPDHFQRDYYTRVKRDGYNDERRSSYSTVRRELNDSDYNARHKDPLLKSTNNSLSTERVRNADYLKTDESLEYHDKEPRYNSEQLERIIRPREGETERKYFSKTKSKSRETIKSPIVFDSRQDLDFSKDVKGAWETNKSQRLTSRGDHNSLEIQQENDSSHREGQYEKGKFDQHEISDDQYVDESKRVKSSSKRAFEYKMHKLSKINDTSGRQIFVSPDYFDDTNLVVKNEGTKEVSKLSKLPLWKRIKKYRIGRIKDDNKNLDLFEADFTEWLKMLRLMKYGILFKRMNNDQIRKLTDEKLEALKITLGARKKILKELARINETKKAQKKKEQEEKKERKNAEHKITKQKNEIGNEEKLNKVGSIAT
ncbi:11219_t:CDS:2 [Acaulospora morrowiae]|uniref:11219_t:CDS:1 n=1 Tax=Acaulospora morrowiae TaxID=94023 RepID=A0A9N9A6Z3_9GLOM|nr:11219_t:CDS:2 [Acaulospora morrowiae]